MMYDIYTKIGERSAEYKCRLNVTVKLRVRLTSIGFRSAALHAEGAVGNNVALSLTPATIIDADVQIYYLMQAQVDMPNSTRVQNG